MNTNTHKKSSCFSEEAGETWWVILLTALNRAVTSGK